MREACTACDAVKLLAEELSDFHNNPEAKRHTFNFDDEAESLQMDDITLRDLIGLAHRAQWDDGAEAPEGCMWMAVAPHSWARRANKFDAMAAAIRHSSYWNESHKLVQVLLTPDCELRISAFNGAPSWNKDDEPEGYKQYVAEHGDPKWWPIHYDGTPFTDEEREAERKKEMAG